MDTCLSLFGEYWVLEAATKSYGSLMDASGHNLIAFLGNLNTLHDRITSTFLNYTPPEFRIENIDDQRYRIHYISTRSGLTPFVVGLLKGLAKRFNTALDILNQNQIPTDSGTHTVFDVLLFANEF